MHGILSGYVMTAKYLLSDRSFLINYLKSNSILLKKSYGQNFVIDEALLNTLIQSAKITPADTVLEIGPGIGTVTERLLDIGARIIAVELDRRFAELLRFHFRDKPNFTLIEGDFLKKSVQDQLKLHMLPLQGKIKVIANLPYYITTPILTNLLQSGIPLSLLVITIQKEVAERLTATIGIKQYSAITIFTRFYGEPEIVAVYPPASFFPNPKVSSAIVHFAAHEKSPYRCEHPLFFHHVVKVCFTGRRKMIKNTIARLIKSWQADINQSQVDSMLQALDISPMIRPEALSVEEFLRISGSLWDLCPEQLRKKFS